MEDDPEVKEAMYGEADEDAAEEEDGEVHVVAAEQGAPVLDAVPLLLVMLNFASNFLIYCSVSNQFKMSLSKVCGLLCTSRVGHDATATSEYYSVAVDTGIRLLGFK